MLTLRAGARRSLAAGVAILASACASPGRDTAQASATDTVATRDSGAGDTSVAAARSPARGVILFVGTSLTAGYGLEPEEAYPQLVQHKIDSAGLPYDVVNAGVSGETSSSLLRRMEWLLRQPIEVIVIETGANDGLRGIPVDAMSDNIQRIIETVRETKPSARIVLVQMEAPPNLGAGYTKGFREVFPELARKNGVHLLPFLLDRVAGIRALNQGDGIHPNAEGERIVAENVWRGLRPILQ